MRETNLRTDDMSDCHNHFIKNSWECTVAFPINLITYKISSAFQVNVCPLYLRSTSYNRHSVSLTACSASAKYSRAGTRRPAVFKMASLVKVNNLDTLQQPYMLIRLAGSVMIIVNVLSSFSTCRALPGFARTQSKYQPNGKTEVKWCV